MGDAVEVVEFTGEFLGLVPDHPGLAFVEVNSKAQVRPTSRLRWLAGDEPTTWGPLAVDVLARALCRTSGPRGNTKDVRVVRCLGEFAPELARELAQQGYTLIKGSTMGEKPSGG